MFCRSIHTSNSLKKRTHHTSFQYKNNVLNESLQKSNHHNNKIYINNNTNNNNNNNRWFTSSSSSSSNNINEEHVSIQRRGLMKGQREWQRVDVEGKEELTTLGAQLKDKISLRGPLSVSSYMNACLASPFGYYTSQSTVFGKEGDFITSPDVSQLFNDAILVWLVSAWHAIGERPFRLVELGPGRAGMLQGILKEAKDSFPGLMDDMKSIELVEVSGVLQTEQRRRLNPLHGNIRWRQSIDEIPNDNDNEEEPLIFLAHEFFDALPVHQFEYTAEGWRERMVDVDTRPASPYHFRFALCSVETPGSHMYPRQVPVFRSRRWKEGDGIEFSAMGMSVMQRMASLIGSKGGAALIVDYGENHTQADTLQGIADHKFCSVLSRPGAVDLSAQVDFSLLDQVARNTENVHTLGLTTQGNMLIDLGIDSRLARLLRQESVSAKKTDALISGYERLTHQDQMGRIYKALCVTSSDISELPGFTLSL